MQSTSTNEASPNVASKVAEVFLTAGHAFQRLGDLTLQLHGADDGEESKWSEGDVEQLREALTKFAHELDTISERVQSRTMQIIKTDIKRRVMLPSETSIRPSVGQVGTLKRAAPGGPLAPPNQVQAKRLIPVTKPSFATTSRIATVGNSGVRLTPAGPAFAPTRLVASGSMQQAQTSFVPARSTEQQYYSTGSAYSPQQ